ncbi:efflux RND transporter permease subunit [Rubinisphaera sp. JC750]|uniref:efflux RND transporter permease subunit n=1 Tax=Rubinisphaera sp. JC750 TaxID=2898658 RepID=UPI001F0065DB|nr:MMPL family transporter [Rubinisphaera sp. JC750]
MTFSNPPAASETDAGGQEHAPVGFVESLAALLLRFRYVLLLLALVATGLAFVPAQRLTLERSIESLFPEDAPILQRYLESKQLFGGDEFVMVAWRQPELLKATGLQTVEKFADKLNDLPGVNASSTQTLTAVLQPEGAGFLGSLFLRIPAIRERALGFAEGALVGEDRKTTAVVVRLTPESDASVSRAETFQQIRDLAAAHPYRSYVVGEPVQVHDMFEIVERDGALLGWASSGILLCIILFLFRSLRWMILPILIVRVSLLWTRAALVLSGIRLSMVSSMLDSLVTIIGIATMMHITVTYRAYRRDYEREESLRRTLVDLLPAIAWTCATTAVGFGALMSSEIVPIQSFGLMMSIGTMMVLLAVASIVPGGVLLGSFSIDPKRYGWESRISAGLQKLLDAVFRFPKTIIAISVSLAILGVAGIPFLRVETDFSKNFHETSPIVQALQFVESNLGGAGNYEVSFDFPSLENEEALERLRALADELRNLEVDGQPAVTKVVAYTDGIDFIPNMAARTLTQKRELLAEMQPEFAPSMFNAQEQRMRILLRALERQPAELKLEMIDRVEEVTAQHFENVKTTGLYVLLANIILSLLADQLVSFGLAACGILLMMTLAFRSLRIGLISLVPNLLPIVLLVGLIGWSGSLINIGTAMIASVSIGLTVDSSIHYLSAYRRGLGAGFSHEESLRRTQGEIGLSLVFSNIALICGFSVLTLSEFVPLNYFGVLVSIAMLGGLAGNIILLPLLLTLLRGPEQNESLPEFAAKPAEPV